jgi:hypothetical protein
MSHMSMVVVVVRLAAATWRRAARCVVSLKERMSMRAVRIVAALTLVFAISLTPETSVAQSGPGHVNGWWLLGTNMPVIHRDD